MQTTAWSGCTATSPLAHPLDDGTAVTIERNFEVNDSALGADGKNWRRLVAPAALHWRQFAADILAPPLHVPHHPLRMARFGLSALQSAQSLVRGNFSNSRTQAIFAGLAAHSFLSLDRPLTAGVGLLFAASLHAVGWPVPRGGARAIPHALIGYLESLGGTVHSSTRIDAAAFRELSRDGTLMMCDLTPRQLLAIAGDQLTLGHRLALRPISATAPAHSRWTTRSPNPCPGARPSAAAPSPCTSAARLRRLRNQRVKWRHGRAPQRPFVLVAQPTLFDPSRAPRGQHVLWAYCHVPNSSTVDMTERIDAQIERFAPGFRDCILARHVSTPATLEAMDANLIGGDISGGAISLSQLLFRPTLREYATSNPKIFLCSSSTPPGAGVHGMCGYHAAKMALRRLLSH